MLQQGRKLMSKVALPSGTQDRHLRKTVHVSSNKRPFQPLIMGCCGLSCQYEQAKRQPSHICDLCRSLG